MQSREESARNRLNKAVNAGRIRRPKRCSECRKPCLAEGHHEDYAKPLDVRWLCRRCHMIADGRLERFLAASAAIRRPKPRKRCQNCRRLSKPLRRGRCHPCNEYLRRRGVERPYIVDGRREKSA